MPTITTTPPELPAAQIHEIAVAEPDATIGHGTRVWAHWQIRSGAIVGHDCVVGRNGFIDGDVIVGDNVKVQNNASLFEGVRIDDGVFIGPHVIFTNDRFPRAVNPDGSLKSKTDWTLDHTTVDRGAAIGAWAMIGSGAIVTRNVPDHVLVVGTRAGSSDTSARPASGAMTATKPRALTERERELGHDAE